MRTPVLLLLVALLLAGCATPYQQAAFRGGYSDFRIDPTTVNVAFHGNGFTPRQRVEMYLLYRCAEVTRQDGYDYFVIQTRDTEAKNVTTPATYSSNTTLEATATGNIAFGQATTYGTYDPGVTLTKYGAEATIKMFRGEKPEGLPNTFRAADVMQSLGPQLGISTEEGKQSSSAVQLSSRGAMLHALHHSQASAGAYPTPARGGQPVAPKFDTIVNPNVGWVRDD